MYGVLLFLRLLTDLTILYRLYTWIFKLDSREGLHRCQRMATYLMLILLSNRIRQDKGCRREERASLLATLKQRTCYLGPPMTCNNKTPSLKPGVSISTRRTQDMWTTRQSELIKGQLGSKTKPPSVETLPQLGSKSCRMTCT